MQPLITARRGGTVLGRYLLPASPFFPDAECRVVSFDADNNGTKDLFFEFPYGLTGENSNVKIIASFFFLSGSHYTFAQLQSFYGSLELFHDFKKDGHVEFACINALWSGADEYDAVNLFSIHNGVVKNVTKTTKGFPIFVKMTGSGPVPVQQLPPALQPQWFLETPDVLTVNSQLMN